MRKYTVARLFQPSAKSGLRADDLAEDLDGGRPGAALHLLDADLEEGVDRRVAGAAPDLPERVLGERAHDVVRIAQGARRTGASAMRAELAEPGGGLAPGLHVRLPEAASACSRVSGAW